MKVEIGTEAPQFPEKEYINGIYFLCSACMKEMRNLSPGSLQDRKKPKINQTVGGQGIWGR